MRKLITALLLASLLLTSVACAAGGDSTTDTKAPDAASTTAAPAETEPTSETLPPIEYPDLTGYTLHVAKIKQSKVAWANNTFVVEGMTGEVLNDAIYERNMKVQAETGATIAETSFDKVKDVISKNGQANDDTYGLYMERIRELGSMTAQGLFYDVGDIGGVQLDQPWWDQDFYADTSVMDQNFMLVGDALLTTADCLYAIIYDKAVAEDLGINDLYATVESGKWTLDAMEGYMKKVTNDLNGDSVYDHNDRYGLIATPAADAVFAFIIGAGETAFAINESGSAVLSANDTRFYNVFDRVQDIFTSADYFDYKNHTAGKDAENIAAMFSGKQALFLPQCISAGGRYLRELDHDFGYLPTPKFDEKQEKYLSHVNMAAPVFLCPVTNAEPDRAGALLDVLARHSHEHVLDVYYENCFSARFARDAESYDMLKIALENKVYDLGFVWKWGDFMNSVAKMIADDSTSLSSHVASVEESIRADIQKTVDALTGK